ncbi:MAG: ribosomal RNA small subunit methyltransferase A [Chloroflexi bacterium]|nr:ribosomal RNA small subunit methyltransferase A [Chloroflexota bacterium]
MECGSHGGLRKAIALLPGAAEPRVKPRSRHPLAVLRELNRRPDRRLSQSFLSDPSVADAMVRAADIGPTDVVLEIGPGLGILTQRLVSTAGSAVCIEVDRSLADALPGILGSPPNLRVVHGDVLSVDLSNVVTEPYSVVASLPYHIASPILFKLVFGALRPGRIVVMLQWEVAARVVARPGDMTYLGAALGTMVDARILRRVAPGSFAPAPKVRSAILRLDLLPEPRVRVGSLEHFLAFLRAGFAQPRKQLHNSLSQGLGAERSTVQAAAAKVGIDSTRRPGHMSLEEWERLYREMEDRGVRVGTEDGGGTEAG